MELGKDLVDIASDSLSPMRSSSGRLARPCLDLAYAVPNSVPEVFEVGQLTADLVDRRRVQFRSHRANFIRMGPSLNGSGPFGQGPRIRPDCGDVDRFGPSRERVDLRCQTRRGPLLDTTIDEHEARHRRVPKTAQRNISVCLVRRMRESGWPVRVCGARALFCPNKMCTRAVAVWALVARI